jgi:hypothetical protein
VKHEPVVKYFVKPRFDGYHKIVIPTQQNNHLFFLCYGRAMYVKLLHSFSQHRRTKLIPSTYLFNKVKIFSIHVPNNKLISPSNDWGSYNPFNLAQHTQKVSSINPDPHIRCIGIRFLKLLKYFLINIIMGYSHIGKHPQEELTKFGYR